VKQNPELIIFTGPMFGGKTTRLLAALDRYRHQKKEVVLLKPKSDGRYSNESVITHNGTSWKCHRVKTGDDIVAASEGVGIVAVDEVFMIPGAAKALTQLFLQGKTVLVSSLQLSYEPKPLPEINSLMPFATRVEICPAVCSECENDAFYTRRKKSKSNMQIEVGGAEEYEPLCYGHYREYWKSEVF